jgi:hypothetical protein
MRAGNWDNLPGESLPALLGILGIASLPLARQHEILLAWSQSASFVPAPQHLKDAVTEFLAKTAPPPVAELPPVPAQQARWQAKLNELFPQGATTTWYEGDSPDGKTAPAFYIAVVALAGLDPVLAFFYPFMVKDAKVMTSFEVVQKQPHVIAWAKFTDGTRAQLAAAIPDDVQDDFAMERKQLGV